MCAASIVLAPQLPPVISPTSNNARLPVLGWLAITLRCRAARLFSWALLFLTLLAPALRAQQPAIDFRNDIEPILSRHGCNAGGCHGKASGQNGFKLSLFGFDANYDHDEIVKHARGR